MLKRTSMADGPLVSHESACETMQAILRDAQRHWTDDDLAAATGVNARTIKSYRVEGKEPTLANALSLLCVLGSPAANRVNGLIGYRASPVDETQFCVNTAVASGLHHFSTIAVCAADGRIDHLEAPICRDAADSIILTVAPLSSIGLAA